MSQLKEPVSKKRPAEDYSTIIGTMEDDGSDSEVEQESAALKHNQVVTQQSQMSGATTHFQGNSTEGRRQRQKRQKGEPKGKMTAYGFFSKEIRTHMNENNQLVLFTELAKQTASLWRNMTEEQKAPYEQMARDDKVRWAREMESFKQAHPHGMEATIAASKMLSAASMENIVGANIPTMPQSVLPHGGPSVAQPKKPRKPRKQKEYVPKDRNAPKGPVNSFLFYYKECREALKKSNPEMENREMGRVAGLRWKAMSAEDKLPYEELAKADKERHARQLHENVVLPPKSPVNSYLFFYADVRAELLSSSPGMDNRDMAKVSGHRWKQMSNEDKAPYLGKPHSFIFSMNVFWLYLCLW